MIMDKTITELATTVANEDFIKSRIFTIRGVQVMLDRDLASIYQVETRVFNQAVKRNENRFPRSFRFRLDMEEYRALTSQIVISNPGKTNTRKQPYTFTELGVAMLNESTRMQLDSISAALANLQSQSPRQKSQQKVGFLKEDTGR